MTDVSELLRAIADLVGALAWPLVLVLFLIKFAPEVKLLLGRLTRLRVLGQEADLTPQLDEAKEQSELAEAESSTLSGGLVPTPALEGPGHRDAAASGDGREAAIRTVLIEAARSPRVGLLTLSIEIDRELALHVAADRQRGRVPNRPVPMRESLRVLAEDSRIPPSVIESAREFQDVRNRIVHGGGASDPEVLRAIDAGMGVLRSLQAIPREANLVAHVGVALFEDEGGRTRRRDVDGLVLRTVTGAGVESLRIFPSDRKDYRVGEQVTWEWDLTRVLDRSWFLNPENDEVDFAWEQASMFVGRHLDEVR